MSRGGSTLKKHTGTLIRQNLHRYLRRDPSALSLIISNLVTILLAVVQKRDVPVLMWIYWSRSLIMRRLVEDPVAYRYSSCQFHELGGDWNKIDIKVT